MDGLERFRGHLLEAGGDGYDEARAGFNLDRPHEPALVAVATTPEDVAVAVGHARRRGLPVAVQATGHGRRRTLEGGILIDTSRLRGLTIDRWGRSARIEAGVPWGQVVAAAGRFGLAPLNGSSPSVGAVGYTLAGGLGLLGRTFGWAADHVRWFDLTTWAGEVRRVSAAGDPDLFWGLRGGGDALGVVTAMEVELLPVATVFGGAVTYDGEDAEAVLAGWRDWTAAAPRELTSSLAMVAMPDVPAVPPPLRGRDTVSVRFALVGPGAAGMALAEPLRRLAPPLTESLRLLPWTECATITNDPPSAHPYQGTGVMLGSLDDGALRAILAAAGPGAPVPTVTQINHLGGALAEPAAEPSLVGHRDARYLLRLLSVVGDRGPAPLDTAHESLVAALGPRVLGRALGFQFGAQPLARWEACFEGAQRRRLRGLLESLR